jgi:hypothetical protein
MSKMCTNKTDHLIWYSLNIVESGVKNSSPYPNTLKCVPIPEQYIKNMEKNTFKK